MAGHTWIEHKRHRRSTYNAYRRHLIDYFLFTRHLTLNACTIRHGKHLVVRLRARHRH